MVFVFKGSRHCSLLHRTILRIAVALHLKPAAFVFHFNGQCPFRIVISVPIIGSTRFFLNRKDIGTGFCKCDRSKGCRSSFSCFSIKGDRGCWRCRHGHAVPIVFLLFDGEGKHLRSGRRISAQALRHLWSEYGIHRIISVRERCGIFRGSFFFRIRYVISNIRHCKRPVPIYHSHLRLFCLHDSPIISFGQIFHFFRNQENKGTCLIECNGVKFCAFPAGLFTLADRNLLPCHIRHDHTIHSRIISIIGQVESKCHGLRHFFSRYRLGHLQCRCCRLRLIDIGKGRFCCALLCIHHTALIGLGNGELSILVIRYLHGQRPFSRIISISGFRSGSLCYGKGIGSRFRKFHFPEGSVR